MTAHWNDPDPADCTPYRTSEHAKTVQSLCLVCGKPSDGPDRACSDACAAAFHERTRLNPANPADCTSEWVRHRPRRPARLAPVTVTELAERRARREATDAARALLDLCEAYPALAYRSSYGVAWCICCESPRPKHAADCAYARAKRQIEEAGR